MEAVKAELKRYPGRRLGVRTANGQNQPDRRIVVDSNAEGSVAVDRSNWDGSRGNPFGAT